MNTSPSTSSALASAGKTMCGNRWGVLLAALFTGHFVATATLATSLNLANDPATGGSGKVAAEEIRREASAKGMTLGEDAATTRVALTVDRDAKAVAQGCSIRVPNDGGRRAITVRGADAAGAMYGGLDVAAAIRPGTLDSLKANNRMVIVLKAKGCHYQYLYCLNAGHGVGPAKPQILPHALEWLWKGYPISKTP